MLTLICTAKRLFILSALFSTLAACGGGSSTPSTSSSSSSSPSVASISYPRLIATASDWQQLPARRAADAELNTFVDLLVARARSDLTLAPLTRVLTGRRLLTVSREFIRRNLQWAFAYRVTGERVFLDRARNEMFTVSAFTDWNPDHYLDVAEMTAGLALGYDWLYNDLSAEDRKTIRTAIVDKGINQARNGHKTFLMTNNWGQVCIGGMVLGALAVEQDEPVLAASLLAAAQPKAFLALDAYKPDGVYPEGPAYWSYGTTYETLLISALRSTKNTDWGLMNAPGLLRSAEFFAHATGPSGKNFNFADGNEGQELSPALFYLARETNQPALLAAKLAMIRAKQGLTERYAPLIALWWPIVSSATSPLGFNGQGPQPASIWRSSWTDPNALYFAIKGGGANHNHAHMDGGSFVLDLDGVRWAKDLGMQDYNSLESVGIDLWNMTQSSTRWSVFRLVNNAHNTLTIDDKVHSATGMASLSMTNSAEALINLTPIFQSGQLSHATRRARVEGSTVTITDDITGAKAGSAIRWAMSTEAAITLNGNEATLVLSGKTLHVRFTGAVTLQVVDISQPRASFDVANPGVRQLVAAGVPAANGSWQVSARFSRD